MILGAAARHDRLRLLLGKSETHGQNARVYNSVQTIMTSVIPFLAFFGPLALMVWYLLDPVSLIDVMQAALPPEARSAPPERPHFAVLLIFLIGIGLFSFLAAHGAIHFPHSAPGLPFYFAVAAACFFGANAIWACYWPVSFQCRYIPQLRNARHADFSPKIKRTLDIAGKCWGVALLILSAYLIEATLTPFASR